jgi:hypothetical protein
VNQRVRIGVVLVVLTGVALWIFLPNNKARTRAEQVRESLRQKGFKVDLSEFDLSTPSGLGAQKELLMPAPDASRTAFALRRVDLMRPISSNSAIVTWNQENPVGDTANDYFWTDLRETLAERSDILDRACEALISAPFRFKTVVSSNGEIVPDVLRARLLASAITARTILELHEHHHLLASTNLLALTRLVTAWQTEPLEISHYMRFRWVATALRVTWEALQSKDWTDADLALLEREWESPNFFAGLPETAALARASTVAFCNYLRQKPPPPGLTLREFISEIANSPNRAWSDATAGWRNAQYRNYESYADEAAWLLFYRDCELDYRRVFAANSWSELRVLQSATNSRPAQASSSVLGIDSLRNMGPAGFGGFPRQGPSLLARAAEAEARRRLLVTAIALRRYHLTNHSYPDSLSKLVPEYLKSCPNDYMDGEPLRYRRTDDDRFLLYSVGLDGNDDHGQLLGTGNSSPFGPTFGRPEAPDLVWPLPASSAEVRAYAQATESKRVAGPVRVMTSDGRLFPRARGAVQAAPTNRFSIPN